MQITRYICSINQHSGCAKYKYIDKQGKTKYVWCNYDPTEKDIGTYRAKSVLFLIATDLFFGFFFLFVPMISRLGAGAIVLGVLLLPVPGIPLIGVLMPSSRKYIPGAIMIQDAQGNLTEAGRQDVKLVRCAYCNGTYGTNVRDACPHCNAPVTIMKE